MKLWKVMRQYDNNGVCTTSAAMFEADEKPKNIRLKFPDHTFYEDFFDDSKTAHDFFVKARSC